VRGSELFDWPALFARVALEFRNEAEDEPWVGLPRLASGGGPPRLASSPLPGTPLREAGLGEGDVITRVGDAAVADREALDARLVELSPGARVEVGYTRGDEERRASVVVGHGTRLVIARPESGRRRPPREARRRRDEWVRSHASRKPDLPEKSCPSCGREYAFALRFCAVDGEGLELP